MHIQIAAVGKIKEDYLKRAIDDYRARLGKYGKVTISEVADEDISQRPAAEVKAREAQRLLRKITPPESWLVVALDREGIEVSSEELARRLESWMVSGKSNVAFFIGGALGLDESITRTADLKLSLSKLTFTHQIARFILLEQLYRAFKIIRGEPYHY